MDVAQHKRRGHRFTFEGDAECVAYRAVCAIAADHVSKGCILRTTVAALEPGRNTFVVLLQGMQASATLDGDAEATEMASKQTLSLVLRQAEL